MKRKKLFNTDAIASEFAISISNNSCPGVEEVFESVVVFPDLTMDELLRRYSGLTKTKFKKAMSWLKQNGVVHNGKLNVKIANFICDMQDGAEM